MLKCLHKPKKSQKKDTFEKSATLKEVSASIKSMEDYENEYQDPFSNADLDYVKNYYNALPQDRKERFEIWLYTTVQETKVDKLSSEKARIIANELRAKENK